MSRYEINIPNTHYQVAFGVDHITSVFIDVYDTSKDEDDRQYRVLGVNNLGVSHIRQLTDRQAMYIQQLKSRFKLAKSQGNPYPNLSANDIVDIFRLFGMDITADFKHMVYDVVS